MPAQVAVLETRIASHAADLKSLTARVAELDARAAGEQAQSDQTKAAETLTNTLPSYLVAIDGGSGQGDGILRQPDIGQRYSAADIDRRRWAGQLASW